MPKLTRRGFLKESGTVAAATCVLATASTAEPTNPDSDEFPTYPPEASEGWSGYRGGYGNAGAVGAEDGFETGFDALETAWEYREYDDSRLPAVVDGTVYQPAEGAVHALDAADGSFEWQSEDVGVGEMPTVAYDTVYVVSDRSVAALDSSNGDVLWQTSVAETTGASTSPPTVAFGLVYTVSDGTLYAIDCETGAIEWRRETVTVTVGDSWEGREDVDRSFADEGGVVVTDESIFATCEAGTIAGVDPRTGEQRTTIDTDYYYLYDLAAADGSVFARTESETVVAYDSSTGEREGEWDGGIRRIAVRENTVVFVTRYELVAVDLESGDQRWSVGRYSHAIGDPVIASDSVLVSFGLRGGEYENSLVAFDLEDGHEQWVFSRTERAREGDRCVVADRTIYVDDGRLTAIRASEDESVSEDRSDPDGEDESISGDQSEPNGEDEEQKPSTEADTDDERRRKRRNPWNVIRATIRKLWSGSVSGS